MSGPHDTTEDNDTTSHYLRERTPLLLSSGPDDLDDIQPDMLPPLSCPRLADRPRELRNLLLFLFTFSVLTTALALLIWLSGWVEGEFELTSVTSTRELRPVPKTLQAMSEDLNSLNVIYHPRLTATGKQQQQQQQQQDEDGEKSSLLLLVLVESQASHVDLRRAARGSWVSSSSSLGVSVAVVFTVAARGLSNDRMQRLEKEARIHGDMAIFPDSAALPESEHLLYQLGWTQNTFKYHYLLRTKDRYYVRLDELMNDLQLYNPAMSPLYWGYFEANRHAKQRWTGKHWEPDWFLCSKFIRFAHSGGYIISQSLVTRLVAAAHYLQLYMNEDVAVATWLSPFGDVIWKHDVRFDTDPGQSRGCQNNYLIFPVNTHSDMTVRQQRLRERGRVCRKEHFLLQPHSFDFNVLPSQCCHTL